MIFTSHQKEYISITETVGNPTIFDQLPKSSLVLLWFMDDASELEINHVAYSFKKNDVIFLTESHQIHIQTLGKTRQVSFNRSFYCILDHDQEVGCKGLLFFGNKSITKIELGDKQRESFENLWKVFEDEMASEDELQLEMLRMLLKRLLILTTRIYKEQNDYSLLSEPQQDLVRDFNFLVNQHFREKHTVACYASLLHKSPKTISNLFAKLGTKTPLQFIQERILQEAKRLLRYSDFSIKEIAYEIGYEDAQSFARFFKKNTGITASQFKEKVVSGKIATS